MARTFKQIEKEKTLDELGQFAADLTHRYAESEFEYSQSNVAEDNNITVKCLRRLMDYAIITSKVSIETAEMVKNKAIARSKLRAKDAGGRSISHHYELMKKRQEYRFTGISDVEKKEIAEDIALNTSKTINFFTEKYNLETDYYTKLVLKSAIVDNIVSDEVMEAIIKRSLGNNPSDKVVEYFNNLRKEREKNKQENSQ